MSVQITLSPERAADALDVSRSFFYERILGELKVIQIGRRKLIPVSELERWAEKHAAFPIGYPNG